MKNMKKEKIEKYWAFGIVFLISFLFLENVYAITISETRYFRNDSILNTTNTNPIFPGILQHSFTYYSAVCNPNIIDYFGPFYWKVDIMSDDFSIANDVISISAQETGEKNASWSPQNIIVYPGNIKVRIKLINGSGNVVAEKSWMTPEFYDTIQLKGTWKFVFNIGYTWFCPEPGLNYFWLQLYYGNSKNPTRIENFTYEYYTPPPPPPQYTDCGLRVFAGNSVIKIACEPKGTVTSPLRIRTNDTTYGIVLVEPNDPNASQLRIKTSSGIKALRKL